MILIIIIIIYNNVHVTQTTQYNNTNLPNNIDACWFVMYAFRVCFSEWFSLAKRFSVNNVSAVPSFR